MKTLIKYKPLRNIALATAKNTPGSLDEDDSFLLESLKERGIKYKILSWGCSDFKHFDKVLIRSTWDYNDNPKEFVNWCESTDNLINPAKVVKWNHNKKYLLELSSIVDVIPTIIYPNSPSHSLDEFIKKIEWKKIVIKPCIGLGSVGTYLLDLDEDKYLKLDNQEYLIQPFIKDINKNGEISIIYINGIFSHAVRKIPKNGDFRSQPEFGSDVSKTIPNDNYLNICQNIIKYITNKFGKLSYTRIDFIDADKPLLIELELIEPCLYFKYNPDATHLLIDTLI